MTPEAAIGAKRLAELGVALCKAELLLNARAIACLGLVARSPRIRATDLAVELQVSLSAISRAVETLVQQGLCKRDRTSVDNREVHITLTDHGAAMIAQIAADLRTGPLPPRRRASARARRAAPATAAAPS